MSKSLIERAKEEQVEAAKERLRTLLPKDGRIYVNVTHRSKPNMTASCTVSVIGPTSHELIRITREVAAVTGIHIRKDELKVSGSSDVAAGIAYALGDALYGEPYSVKPDYV